MDLVYKDQTKGTLIRLLEQRDKALKECREDNRKLSGTNLELGLKLEPVFIVEQRTKERCIKAGWEWVYETQDFEDNTEETTEYYKKSFKRAIEGA